MIAVAGPAQIAVIGMAGRFPGAADVAEFWRNLRRGVPAHQSADVDPSLFDADFFELTAQEAGLLDPQHRMFLECCWNAVEAAGYAPDALPGVGALFGGCSFPDYLMTVLLEHPDVVDRHGPIVLAFANDRDAMVARVGRALDLRGPCLGVQAFSATGLAAVHLAAQSLLLGECDFALAGSASVRLGAAAEQPLIRSSSGICAPLEDRADGTRGGNGVGVVVLRRLADARRDGDHVHAVLAGSAVANAGRNRPGGFGPASAVSAGVVAEALAVAGLQADDLGYLEAHASGTVIGDGLEIEAMSAVFAPAPAGTGPLIGAVAANVGHLDAAAGMAALIKTVLVVEHDWIPPQPGLRAPSAAVRASPAGFTLPAQGRAWRRNPGGRAGTPAPRRAGVSSLGLGGTEVHVVVSQVAPPDPAGPDPAAAEEQLFVLSARTDPALRASAHRLRRSLLESWFPDWPPAWSSTGTGSTDPVPLYPAPVPSLAAVAYTLQVGRAAHERRAAFVAATPEQVLAGLDGIAADGPPGSERPECGSLGLRWLGGDRIDWQSQYEGRAPLRTPLPGYQFQRHRHWAAADPGLPGEPPPTGRAAGTSRETTRRGRGG